MEQQQEHQNLVFKQIVGAKPRSPPMWPDWAKFRHLGAILKNRPEFTLISSRFGLLFVLNFPYF
jgi:hypothetical protein